MTKRLMIQLAGAMAILALLTPAIQAQDSPGTIAVKNVSVVDVEAGRVLANRTVIIDGADIAAVLDAASAKIPAGARVIEGDGLYLMPGLFDAHVHYINPDSYRYSHWNKHTNGVGNKHTQYDEN